MLIVINILEFFLRRLICVCKYDLADSKMLLWGLPSVKEARSHISGT